MGGGGGEKVVEEGMGGSRGKVQMEGRNGVRKG